MKKDNLFCTLYIVRHGETEWNVKNIIQGQSDSPLTEKGINQAKATAEKLKDIKFAAAFSSDLFRTRNTAELIKLDRQLSVVTEKALRERNFGSYEGKSGDDFGLTFKHLFEKLKDLSEFEQRNLKFASDIESDEEIISRFILKLREIAVAYPAKNVLVVTHGGPIRTFLMHLGYTKYGKLHPNSFSNAGYAIVQCDGIDFYLKEVKGVIKIDE